jgi:FkbM family methyltransferase
MIKKIIIRVCNGIVNRLSSKAAVTPGRSNSMEDALAHIKKLGFEPETIIDVGAADGTPTLYGIFPDAYHFAIEPLFENENALKELKKKYKLDYLITAVGSYEGNIKFNVHTDHLEGSSLLKEQVSEFDGIEREVPIQSLNKIRKDFKLKGPYLLKIDTQGSELDILKGCSEILNETEYIILEMSFFEFYKGQPIIEDIILFLKEKGFTLYDIGEVYYRPLDNACGQTDMAFVKKNGRFRSSNEYASLEQWNNR